MPDGEIELIPYPEEVSQVTFEAQTDGTCRVHFTVAFQDPAEIPEVLSQHLKQSTHRLGSTILV